MRLSIAATLLAVDGKWELTGVVDAAGMATPRREGQVTLVVKRSDTWMIEAYRYTAK